MATLTVPITTRIIVVMSADQSMLLRLNSFRLKFFYLVSLATGIGSCTINDETSV